MYGVLTSNRSVVRAAPGSVSHFVVEEERGHRREPIDGVINTVACWGDTAAVAADLTRAACTEDGTRAVPQTDGHHWGTVCPTDTEYRTGLLDRLSTIGGHGAIRLTTAGFPGVGFCRCDRCEQRFTESETDDRQAWRANTITEFVTAVRDRVAGELIVTLYPDPYPGNLRRRTGIDPQALAAVVDGFLVPLCSISYETTYWVESLASGFYEELSPLDVSLGFQLSAGRASQDRLVAVTQLVEPYADTIVYGTSEDSASDVRSVIRRCRATASGTVSV